MVPEWPAGEMAVSKSTASDLRFASDTSACNQHVRLVSEKKLDEFLADLACIAR